MNFNESLLYDNKAYQSQTYKNLFDELLENYFINSSNNSISNGTLKSKFNEFLNIISVETDPEFQSKNLMKNVAVFVGYSLIILVSLFGNLLVCYIILSKQRLRTRTTNILIANLTISDLLMTILNIPITTGNHIFSQLNHFLTQTLA
jgi:hypothetical protein